VRSLAAALDLTSSPSYIHVTSPCSSKHVMITKLLKGKAPYKQVMQLVLHVTFAS
jgi:hypothetical protein